MHILTKLLKSAPKTLCSVFRRFNHLDWSPNFKLSKKIKDRYSHLPIPDCKIFLTYVWIDGTGEHLRSKMRILDYIPATVKDCPTWHFDGSSCYLAESSLKSDVLLNPVALYNDPIMQGNNKIVLCETFNFDNKPSITNYRHNCMDALNKICEKEAMFGLEQEYQMMDVNQRPFGWPVMCGEPAPAGPYYCGVGAEKAYGRDIVEAHFRCSLFAGVEISGINAEVVPAQWEFQTGPTLGIKAADDLWMARYLLHAIAEEFGVAISLHPKLFPNWNGAGCHVNISTKETRDDNGIKAIEDIIAKLEKKHKEHLQVYDPYDGKQNMLRLTGKHETSSSEVFSWGISDRSKSVRITKDVAAHKKGYLEDRRPSSNCDPYRVINAIVNTVFLSCDK